MYFCKLFFRILTRKIFGETVVILLKEINGLGVKESKQGFRDKLTRKQVDNAYGA